MEKKTITMEISKMITCMMVVTGTTIIISTTTFAQGPGITDSVKIGTQVWTATNLTIASFRNGDMIPEVKSEEEWKKAAAEKRPAWCYYDNDPKNGKKYGRLYNWYAIIDPRGFAPEGWHVPTKQEWQILENNLGGELAGYAMKAKDGGWARNGNGNNASGFNAIAGGYRDYYVEYGDPNCYFSIKGNWGMWWTSTDFGSAGDMKDAFGLYYQFGYTRWMLANKGAGNSVRLIKN